MTHPLLAIDNLSIAFRQQGETQTVVHNLSLEVAVGETLALVGESGSGKSISALSVLRLLPTPPASYPSGDIRFHGQSLLHADEATLRGVRGNRIAMIDLSFAVRCAAAHPRALRRCQPPPGGERFLLRWPV